MFTFKLVGLCKIVDLFSLFFFFWGGGGGGEFGIVSLEYLLQGFQ